MRWKKKTRRRQPAGDEYLKQLKQLYAPDYSTAIKESFDDLLLRHVPRIYGGLHRKERRS